MGQVLVRNVGDDTMESYRLDAKLKGHSLEQELRGVLEEHKPFTPEERVAAARDFRSRYKEIQHAVTLDDVRDGLV